MLFGSICNIQQRCNEMLASCGSRWRLERQYDTFGWKMETTTRKRGALGGECWVQRRCWWSAQWNRTVPNSSWGELKGKWWKVGNETEERQSRQRCSDWDWAVVSQRRSTKKGWVRSVECIIGVQVGNEQLLSQAEVHGVGGIKCRMG